MEVGVSLSLKFGCDLILGLQFGFGFGFVCDFGGWGLRLWVVVAVVVGVVCGSGLGFVVGLGERGIDEVKNKKS